MDRKIKVLMLGWEYPPVVAGGLGPAFYGLSQALAKKVDLLVVVPRSSANLKADGIELIGLNNLEISQQTIEEEISAFEKEIEQYPQLPKIHTVDTDLPAPYPDSRKLHRQAQAEAAQIDVSTFLPKKKRIRRKVFGLLTEDNDPYGPALMQKVALYTELVCKLVKDWEFDVIHAHDWVTFPAAVKIKELTGKPLVTHIHSLETDRSGIEARNQVFEIEQKAMQASDVVLPVSDYTRSEIQSHYQTETPIVVVPNGKEAAMSLHQPEPVQETSVSEASQPQSIPETPQPVSDTIQSTSDTPSTPTETTHQGISRILKELPKGKVITFLGRLTWQKNPQTFLRAAAILCKKISDLRFVIAGSGELMRPLMQEAKSLRISQHVVFTGFITRQQVKELISVSEIFFLPSVSEPFGLSALEAAQNGLPVVISRQSGIGGYLPGTLKADFWDAPKFAELLYGLLRYPAIRRDSIKINELPMSQLDWDCAAELILKNYEQLLS